MDDSTRERLVDGNIWLRGLHMLIFLIAYNIAEAIIVLLALFQFVCVLITGGVNEPLRRFGKNLTIFAADVFEFLTFNSEVRPFPFEPWPDEEAGGDSWEKKADDADDTTSEVVIDQEESPTTESDTDTDTDTDTNTDTDDKKS